MMLKDVMKLTRIEHSLLLVVAVITAELLVGGKTSPGTMLLSLVAPLLIGMGSFAINDYFDIKVDTTNKKLDRPLVSGVITKDEAVWITLFCFVVGILAALFINMLAFVIALVYALLAVLYSYKLKESVLAGNLYIASTTSIAFIYGNYVVAGILATSIIYISIIAFLANLGREIHGMIRDYSGDRRARNAKNLVFYLGKRKSAYLAFVLYAEAVIISVFVFFFQFPFAHNLAYIVPIFVADVAQLYIAFGYLAKKESRRFYVFARNLGLLAMGIGLIGFLSSALFYIYV